MPDLTFNCPECSNNLIVDDQATGQIVSCPECGTQIRVPDAEEDNPAAAETADLAEEGPSAAETADLAEEALSLQQEEVPGGEPVMAPEMTFSIRREYQVVSVLAQITDVKEIRANVVGAILNEQAREGWLLRTASIVQTCDEHGKPQQDMLLFLERTV